MKTFNKIFIALVVMLTISVIDISALTRVGQFGDTGDISVASGQYIILQTTGTAKLYKKAGYPTFPSSWTLVTTVNNSTYKSAVTTAVTYFKIEAGVDGAWYDTGATPYVELSYGNLRLYQSAPTADTTNDTLTVAEMLGGIITIDSTGDVDLTLPTGAVMEAGLSNFGIDNAFDWYVINIGDTSDDVADITASSAHTIVGETTINPPVADGDGNGGPSAGFRTRKTAASTFETYRIH